MSMMLGMCARVRVVATIHKQRLFRPSRWASVANSGFQGYSTMASWEPPENMSLTSWDIPFETSIDDITHEIKDEALDQLLSETIEDNKVAAIVRQAVAKLGVKEVADMQYVRSTDLYTLGVPVVVTRRLLEACKPVQESSKKSVNLLRLSQNLQSLPFKKVGPIKESDVRMVQDKWGKSLIEIGRTYSDGGDYSAVAAAAIDDLYAYGRHNVLFKPTKAADAQFRSCRKDALSYFVGGDAQYPEDTGFALTPWTAVRFEPCNLTQLDDITLAMGNYFFTDKLGKETKVEYTFGYWRDENGDVRIVLHHSSLPFKKLGPITEAEVHTMQERWGQSIVDIGRAYLDGQDYAALAAATLDELYAYGQHDVLFKPTKAATLQFRSDRKDALSYFIGGDASHPEDAGFALTPWTAVRFEPSGLTVMADSTVAMGNYFFTDTTGNETKVEYTFGYWRDENCVVRIVLHHSSLPFQS